MMTTKIGDAEKTMRTGRGASDQATAAHMSYSVPKDITLIQHVVSAGSVAGAGTEAACGAADTDECSLPGAGTAGGGWVENFDAVSP